MHGTAICPLKVVTNAVGLLDNIEEWPTEIVEQKSNE